MQKSTIMICFEVHWTVCVCVCIYFVSCVFYFFVVLVSDCTIVKSFFFPEMVLYRNEYKMHILRSNYPKNHAHTEFTKKNTPNKTIDLPYQRYANAIQTIWINLRDKIIVHSSWKEVTQNTISSYLNNQNHWNVYLSIGLVLFCCCCRKIDFSQTLCT